MCADVSVSAVKSELQQDGFIEVACEEDFDGKTFMVDDQCTDVLSFPNELISYVERHPLVTSGALVLQVSILHECGVERRRTSQNNISASENIKQALDASLIFALRVLYM